MHIYVDEVGYQAKIAADKASLYTGTENVPALDEATQGSYYAQLIAMMACDPNVALLNFFHAVDETSLPAWQSGVVLPDGTRRASFTAVKDAIMAKLAQPASLPGPLKVVPDVAGGKREAS